MKKINFVNNDAPYLSAENLNQMQDNIEEAIGEIVESGTSGGIDYIKYGNGTLIQHFIQTITTSESRNAGGLTYYSGEVSIDLPIPFVNTSYRIFANVAMANMNYFAQSYGAPISNNRMQISFASTEQNGTRPIHVFAIGKWK